MRGLTGRFFNIPGEIGATAYPAYHRSLSWIASSSVNDDRDSGAREGVDLAHIAVRIVEVDAAVRTAIEGRRVVMWQVGEVAHLGAVTPPRVMHVVAVERIPEG